MAPGTRAAAALAACASYGWATAALPPPAPDEVALEEVEERCCSAAVLLQAAPPDIRPNRSTTRWMAPAPPPQGVGSCLLLVFQEARQASVRRLAAFSSEAYILLAVVVSLCACLSMGNLCTRSMSTSDLQEQAHRRVSFQAVINMFRERQDQGRRVSSSSSASSASGWSGWSQSRSRNYNKPTTERQQDNT
mmetsp:Transcript_133427/g.372005  ORF Transcript_133427/g.372005 Transcript_133427/m.372005 type:complete len:192 (-) Transcript_133427:234-809(-)